MSRPFRCLIRIAVAIAVVSAANYVAAQMQVNWAKMNKFTAAVDANGSHHRGTDYQGRPPWIDDITASPMRYPYEARHLHQSGVVQLHVSLEVSSGRVINATLTKSSGSDVLDSTALTEIHKWQWKPGKWKEIELPIAFYMEKGRSLPPSTATPRIHR